MTSDELTHFKKMVRVWETKSLLFCLRYDPLIVFRRQNHITFIFIKTMSHDLLVQMAYIVLRSTAPMRQGPVARSLLSANRWLRGIKMYRFLWYLTLVSTNHACFEQPGPELQKKNYWSALFQKWLCAPCNWHSTWREVSTVVHETSCDERDFVLNWHSG